MTSNKTSDVTKLFDNAGNPDDKGVVVLKDVQKYPNAKFADDVARITQEQALNCIETTQGEHGDVYVAFDTEKFAQAMKDALKKEGFNMRPGNPDAIVSVETKEQAEKLLDPSLCNPAEPFVA